MHDLPHSFPFFGETLALINAVTWAYVVILFKICGTKVGPTSLNIFKIAVGLVLMIFTTLIMQLRFFPNLEFNIYLLLAISGILGIGIADTLFFKSLNLLGASRSAIVDCLYSPFIIFFSFIFLGEHLSFNDAVGALLVVSSLFLLSSEGRADRIDRKSLINGIFAGVLSMSSMAFGIIIIKPMLSDLPVVWVAMIRMFFGVVALALFSFFQPERKKTWSIFLPQKIWRVVLPACLLGSYVTMLLWIGSFKFASANVAGILTQLSVVFTVIFAYLLLKEPLTKRKIISLILALFGSFLVIGS